MKKKFAIFLLILTVISISAVALTACNDSDKLVATFEFDENDGLDNFVLRRGIFLEYVVSELQKIDGIGATWKVNNDGKVQLEVENVRTYSERVREIINGEPKLQFKTLNFASEPASFLGKDNIESIACSYDKRSIEIKFTALGAETVNDYLGRPLYIYLGDDYLLTMTSQFILTGSDRSVRIQLSDNVYPMFAETYEAHLNVGAFGLKIKNLSIK